MSDKPTIFSRPECIFNYCPHPDQCDSTCLSPSGLPPELIDLTPRCAATGDPCPSNDRVIVLESELTALRAANAEMLEVLGNVSRMRMFPDDKINRMTLLAAIEIALAALNR